MKRTHSKIATSTRLFEGRYGLLLLLFVLYGILDLLKFAMLGSMVDMFTDLPRYSRQISRMVFLVAVCAFCGYCFDVIVPYVKSIIVEDKMAHLRVGTGNKLMNISYREIERMDCGDILSKVMNDIDTIQVFLEKKEPEFIILLIKGLLGGAACLLISWKFAITFLIIIPVVIGLGILSGKAEEGLVNVKKTRLSDINKFVVDIMNHFLTVKVFDLPKHFCDIFDEKSGDIRAIDIKIANRRAAFSFLNAFSQLLPTIVMMAVGAVLVYSGEVTTGRFTIMLAMSSRVANLLGGIQDFIYSRQGYKSSRSRLEEIWNLPDEKKNETVTRLTEDSALIFSDVSFSFHKNKVLSGINMQVREGEHIGIVGRSGCGKSTLIKLILTLYDCYEGEIYVNGIKNVPGNGEYIRENMAAVLQDNYLFPISVKENIALFVSNYDTEEVTEAAKAAGIYEFIQSLPQKFDTIIENGIINLSGGQKQRVCIARAYMKHPKLLLLDEPTAAMDLRLEADIVNSIDEWMSGKTMITVAHHLSTIKGADRIYYMEEGKIVESGTYEELCRSKGGFYRLYENEIIGGALYE